MPSLPEMQDRLARARERRDAGARALTGARARLAEVEARLAVLARIGRATPRDNEGAAALREKDALQAEIERAEAEVSRGQAEVQGLLVELVALEPPQGQVESLSDSIPFLLLPVRVETRFRTAARGGDELCVRIYPDDVAVDAHEEPLTADERAVGRAYWEAVWRAGGNAAAELAAWRGLVAQSDPPRAAWIARTMEPQGAKPPQPVPPDQPLDPEPVFPEPAENPSSWSRAPQSRVMPDRFVVITYADGARSHEVVGNPVPDPLIVGPDPARAESMRQEDGSLDVDPGMRWITDFDEAVRVGMGIRVPLTSEERRRGLDLLLVLGLRLSSDGQDGKARLEALLDGHHYSVGLSLVPQGTPTNNTGTAQAGATDPRADTDELFRVERGAPLFATAAGDFERADGDRLAQALGVDPAVLQHVRHADRADGREAMAMNRALWPATLGYFMEEMMRPVFSLDAIARTRAFFTRWVIGRGALPAIRVGPQPYGVLPTTVFSRWRAEDGDGRFGAELDRVLKRLGETWSVLAARVSRAGMGADPYASLLDVLGLHGSSVEFHQRMAVGPDYTWNLLRFTGAEAAAPVWSGLLRQAATDLLAELGHGFPQVPKIFELTFLRDHTLLTGPVIDDAPISETEPIKPAGPGLGNYIRWLSETGPEGLRTEDFGVDAQGQPRLPPRALLYLLLRQALLRHYWDAAMRLHVREGVVTAEARREKELVNIGSAMEATPWDYLRLSVPSITGTMPVAEYLRSPVAAQLPEASELAEAQAALPTLAGLPTARLERLLAEHLDLCSYRLDAWRLGLVHERLSRMRAVPPPANPDPSPARPPAVPHGVYLGAYGWLQDLRAAPPPRLVPPNEVPDGVAPGSPPLAYPAGDGGHVHAPSLDQAVAAAALRSAYLSHARRGEADAMSVNLSSARVRRALAYLDGMRNGQELGALLGYRFERALHDGNATLNLDQYIYAIRRRFPLVDRRVTPAPEDTADTVAARNVVDGLRLVRAVRGETYPFEIPDLPPAGSAEATALLAELDHLEDDLDAVADLALSESVYQSVLGNYDRAGGLLKSMGEGGSPPEPQVIETPRGALSATHRVGVVFDANAPSGNPWPGVPVSPRAAVEPRFNHWAATMLGDPTTLRARVGYVDPVTEAEQVVEVTLAELELQPLDLLYVFGREANDLLSELQRRVGFVVRRRESLPVEVELQLRLAERGTGWGTEIKTFAELLPLATGLHGLVADRRPLAGDDFRLAGDAATDPANPKGLDAAELSGRVTDARDALVTARGAVQTARDAAAVAGAPIPPATLDTLRAALLGVSAFGIPDAVPVSGSDATVEVRDELVAQATRSLEEADRRRSAADAALASAAAPGITPATRVDRVTEAARAVFGRAFRVLPGFVIQNAVEVQLSLHAQTDLLRDAPPLPVEEWAQSASRARPRLAAYQRCRLLAETFGQTPPERLVAQLPFAAQDHWIALPLTGSQEPAGDTLSLVLEQNAEYATAGPQWGLLVDEWTEVIPTDAVVTGLGFQFDRPASEPPQCLLLAVPPVRTGRWQWDDLVDMLRETLDLARTRAVEPDLLGTTAYAQILPAIVSPVTRHPVTITSDFGANVGSELYAVDSEGGP